MQDDDRDIFSDFRAVRAVAADSQTKHLLLVLMTYVRQDSCWPSAALLANNLGIKERMVRYRLDEAEKNGWIVRESRFSPRGQASNRIVLNFDKIYKEQYGVQSVAPHAMGCIPPMQPIAPPPCNGLQAELPILTTNRTVNNKTYDTRSKISWNQTDGWIGDILTERKAAWSAAFPACDIEAQLARAHVWLLANPQKAKKSNWERFVSNWLSRQQDRGGDAKTAPPSNKPPKTSRLFEKFMLNWPKNGDKSNLYQCAIFWQENNLDEIIDVIMKGLRNNKNSAAWRKDEGKFIPSPFRWLKEKRYYDKLVADPSVHVVETMSDEEAEAINAELAAVRAAMDRRAHAIAEDAKTEAAAGEGFT